MKTKSILILSALMVFSIQSCDDYLKETLVSDVAASTYYLTATGIEDGVDATYAWLKLVYSNERAHSLTTFGTDAYTNGADGNFKNFNYYDAGLRSDQSILNEMWSYCYKGVNQANAMVGRIPLVATGMTDAQKTLRIAEVRYLRALYYFTIVRQWGSAPMPLTETVGLVTSADKSSVADIYSKAMIPDLTFAAANLPATQSDYGRATKGAAQHLLGLVLLTRGWMPGIGTAQDFVDAETNFTAVINGPYALQADLGRVFDQSNGRNSEIIFSVQNSTNVLFNSFGDDVKPGEGNRAHLYYLMEYDTQPGMIRDIAGGRPFKRFRPTDYLLNLWENSRATDNRFDVTYKQAWISNNPLSIPKWTQAQVDAGAKNKDGSAAVVGQNRFAVGDTAFFIPGPGAEAKWLLANAKLKSRYTVYTRADFTEKVFSHTLKHIDPLRPAIQWTEGSRNWFISRLGDTYLLRAEARFKQGNNPGAVADINVIRTRSQKVGKNNQFAGTVTLNDILDERAKELDAEMTRWYDLTRTNTLVDRVKLYAPLGAPNIKDYHVRRPYPQTQLDRTLPAGSFVQNCGYPGGPSCN